MSEILEQLKTAIQKLTLQQRKAFDEDKLAAISAEYLESIRAARQDYKEGRVYSHDEVFE